MLDATTAVIVQFKIKLVDLLPASAAWAWVPVESVIPIAV